MSPNSFTTIAEVTYALLLHEQCVTDHILNCPLLSMSQIVDEATQELSDYSFLTAYVSQGSCVPLEPVETEHQVSDLVSFPAHLLPWKPAL